MKLRCMTCCMAALVFAQFGSPLHAETVKEAEKKIIEAASKHKSVMTKSKYKSEIKMEGFMMKSEGEATAEYKRKGDKGYQMRMESKSNDVRKMGDAPEEKSKSESLMITDGEHMYTLTVSGDQKSAMKMKLDPKQTYSPFDAERAFKLLHEDHDVKLLKDEKIDGKECYVFEIKPKKTDDAATAMTIGKMTHYYDKKTGISMKSVTYDKDGKEMTVATTTEVKLNPDISDDRFVFKAPEGVQVVDMTNLGQSGETETASTDATEEAEEEEEEPAKQETAQKPEKKEEKKEEKKGLGGLFNKLK